MKIQQGVEGIIVKGFAFFSWRILMILWLRVLSSYSKFPGGCGALPYSRHKVDSVPVLCYQEKYDELMCNVSHFGFN